jgi:hypothetical protein
VKAFFGEPVVRLFLRALLVACVTFATKFFVFDPTGNHVTYQMAALGAAATSAALAFAETFTPLNGLVGILKIAFPPVKAAPAEPTTPPSLPVAKTAPTRVAAAKK